MTASPIPRPCLSQTSSRAIRARSPTTGAAKVAREVAEEAGEATEVACATRFRVADLVLEVETRAADSAPVTRSKHARPET